MVSIAPSESLRQGKFYESNAGDGSEATDQHLHGYRLMLTLVSCVVALFIVALDQTIISTILTEVGDNFSSFSLIGWLTSGYLLPMACFAPSYGKISIAFGRKNTLLAAIVIFEVGSLVAALANSMDMLIGGRVIQGIGGGGVLEMIVVILTESVPMSKRALSMTLLGVTFSLASVVGPFAGGVLATKVSWRWCFYINLPLGGFAFLLLLVSFNPPKPEGNVWAKLRKIDFLGTFLLTSGLVLLLLAITFGGVDFPWNSAAVICCFVLGGVVLILFTIYNFGYSTSPIIIKEIIIIPQVFAACMFAAFNFGFFMVSLTFLAVYFQVIFNASAFRSGIDLLPFILSMTLAATFNGVFMRFTRYIKITLMVSAIFGPLGTGLLLLLNESSPVRDRIGLMIILGISIGLQFQSSLLSAQMKAPNNISGSLIIITVFLNFVKSAGLAVAVSLGQLVFTSSGTSAIDRIVQLTQNATIAEEISRYPTKALIQTPRIINSLSTASRALVIEAFMSALHNVFYFCLGLSFIALVGALFTTNQRIPRDRDVYKGNKESVESS